MAENGKGPPAPKIIPILGGQKVLIGAQLGAMPRSLNELGGIYATKLVQQPNGTVQPVMERGDYVDAEELCEMIRAVVREELKAALKQR